MDLENPMDNYVHISVVKSYLVERSLCFQFGRPLLSIRTSYCSQATGRGFTHPLQFKEPWQVLDYHASSQLYGYISEGST